MAAELLSSSNCQFSICPFICPFCICTFSFYLYLLYFQILYLYIYTFYICPLLYLSTTNRQCQYYFQDQRKYTSGISIKKQYKEIAYRNSKKPNRIYLSFFFLYPYRYLGSEGYPQGHIIRDTSYLSFCYRLTSSSTHSQMYYLMVELEMSPNVLSFLPAQRPGQPQHPNERLTRNQKPRRNSPDILWDSC